jgi:dsRNA-specific ribonuclease
MQYSEPEPQSAHFEPASTSNETKIMRDGDILKSPDGTIPMIFNPYNPLNQKITEDDVKTILTTYGLPPIVNNIYIYERAFVHQSYIQRKYLNNAQQTSSSSSSSNSVITASKPDDCMKLSSKSNQRMEFLGDGVLELVTKYILYRRFPLADEKFMTDKKIDIVKNIAIGRIALEMGLNKWYIISKYSEENNVRTELKQLGCLFEAFVGAVFLDNNKIQIKDELFETLFETTGPGFQMAQVFIENVFERHIDWIKLVQTNTNYKNSLQVMIQQEFKVTPLYLQLGYNIDTGFHMGVFLCIGYPSHVAETLVALNIGQFKSVHDIHAMARIFATDHPELIKQKKGLNNNELIFVKLGMGIHKIKRNAEQNACHEAIKILMALAK